MSTSEIISKIESLREWEAVLDEASGIVEGIRDELKAHMDAVDTEQLEAGQYILRFTRVQASRFDTKRFKTEMGEELYKKFTKEVASRRFTVSG